MRSVQDCRIKAVLFADAYELCRPISDERVQAKVGLRSEPPSEIDAEAAADYD